MDAEVGAGRQEVGGGISPSSCIVPVLLLLVAVAVGGGLLLINCLRASPSSSYSTRVDALPPETPVYLSEPGLYLVRLAEGVLALSHHEQRREDGERGCVIRWRETLEREGRRGLFRSDCRGTLYDPRGTPVEGDGASMKRHPVMMDGERVRVDLRSCIPPAGDGERVPCDPTKER